MLLGWAVGGAGAEVGEDGEGSGLVEIGGEEGEKDVCENEEGYENAFGCFPVAVGGRCGGGVGG